MKKSLIYIALFITLFSAIGYISINKIQGQAETKTPHYGGAHNATEDADIANAALANFPVMVSRAYANPYVVMIQASAVMDSDWFTERNGGRTVYSSFVPVGRLVHGVGNIIGHATWVINYNAATRTVNFNRNQAHITTTYNGNQTCRVYEDGTCNCRNNPNWTICGTLPEYVQILKTLAVAARLGATVTLREAGYTVTNN